MSDLAGWIAVACVVVMSIVIACMYNAIDKRDATIRYLRRQVGPFEVVPADEGHLVRDVASRGEGCAFLCRCTHPELHRS